MRCSCAAAANASLAARVQHLDATAGHQRNYSGAAHVLTFIGTNAEKFGRAACLRAISQELVSRHNASLDVLSHVWSDVALARTFRRRAFFLSTDKYCNTGRAHDCNTLRFAPTLAEDGFVLATECNAEDRREWRGLVHFGSVRDHAEVFEALWRMRQQLTGPRIEFARRFAPEELLRRADW